MKQVTFDAQAKVRMLSYLSSYPFPTYLLVRQIDSMPDLFAEVLQQWLTAVMS